MASWIIRFENMTEWKKRARHASTFICFVLAIVDESPAEFSDPVVDTIAQIYDYMEGRGEMKDQNRWAGDLACQKWQMIHGKTTREIYQEGIARDKMLAATTANAKQKALFDEYVRSTYG